MDMDLDDLDPAELAEAKKRQKKREEEEAELEKLMEDIREREEQRRQEEERDMELQEARKQRQTERIEREKKRAIESEIRTKKKEEEWARKREVDIQRKLERENKIKKLQAQAKPAASSGTGINPLDIIKANMEMTSQKKANEEQERAQKKEEAVKRRVPDERFERLREAELIEKAEELHKKITDAENAKYDIELNFKKQNYDIKELNTRINEIQRRKRKTIHLGGSRRKDLQETEEKSFLGVKGMIDKYTMVITEKNKPVEKKKPIEIPKRHVTDEGEEGKPSAEMNGDVDHDEAMENGEPEEVEMEEEEEEEE